MEMNSKKENGKAGSSLLPCSSCGSTNKVLNLLNIPRIVHPDDTLTYEIFDRTAIPCCNSKVCELRAGQILKLCAEVYEDAVTDKDREGRVVNGRSQLLRPNRAALRKRRKVGKVLPTV